MSALAEIRLKVREVLRAKRRLDERLRTLRAQLAEARKNENRKMLTIPRLEDRLELAERQWSDLVSTELWLP